MNTSPEVEPTELEYLVWQLRNMNSTDPTARRNADHFVTGLASAGEDFRMLTAVLMTSKENAVLQTAGVCLKSHMSANLKITDYPKDILQYIEQTIIKVLALGTMPESVEESLCRLVTLVYAQRHWNNELENSAKRCLDLMASDQLNQIRIGSMLFEQLVSSLLGLSLSSVGYQMLSAVVNILLAKWEIVKVVLQRQSTGTEENSATTQESQKVLEVYSGMIKACYRLLARASNQDTMVLVVSFLSSHGLIGVLLPEIFKEHQKLLSTHQGTVLLTEAFWLASRLLECVIKFELVKTDYSQLARMICSAIRMSLPGVPNMLNANDGSFLKDSNAAVKMVLYCKSVLKIFLNSLKLSTKISQFYELGTELMSHVYMICIVAFRPRKFDLDHFEDEPSTYLNDLSDYCKGHTIGDLRSIVGEVLEELVSEIDPALSSIAALAFTNLYLNTGLDEKVPPAGTSPSPVGQEAVQKSAEILLGMVKRLDLQANLMKGENTEQCLLLTCCNIVIISNMKHVLPTRSDLK